MNFPKITQLPSFRSVTFHGQRVSVERTPLSVTGFCVTGWENGFPVARKPIAGSDLMELLQRYPHTFFS